MNPASKNSSMLLRFQSFLLALFTLIVFTGCTPFMVSVNAVDDAHVIRNGLTESQVRDAILKGAEAAGWRAKDLGHNTIGATYKEKSHLVEVHINYGGDFYVTRYESSQYMKMYCSYNDQKKQRNMKISGQDRCPGYAKPVYIHKAYKTWMDRLNNAIQTSLASI
jgi:hypothetical protein